MRFVAAGAVLMITGLLVGCGQEAPQKAVAPAAEQETPVADTSAVPTYASLVDLREAAVSAGYVCREWVVDDPVPDATQSGSCRDYDAFALFEDEAHIDLALTRFEAEPGDLGIMTGPNWVIRTKPSEVEMMSGNGMAGEVTTRSAADGPPEPEAEPTQLEAAAEWCDATDFLADDGTSFSVITGGDETPAHGTIEQLVCVLVHVETPDHVIAHIESTRALDGQQTTTWGDFSARWTYHPDDGLAFTLVEQSD